MISIFDIPTNAPNDQSVFYLGQIFGVVGDVIPQSNFSTSGPALTPAQSTWTAWFQGMVAAPDYSAPTMVSTLFQVLNSVALTVGVLIITYTTIVGLFYTATEGEFLGKKWNKVWVPIRTVIGIAGLFPSATGYCAIQIVLMWLVLQGIGAADLLWKTALNVIGNVGLKGSLSVGNDTSSDLNNKFALIFQGLVCQATAYKQYAPIPFKGGPVGTSNPVDSISYFCASNRSNEFCNNSNIYNMSSGTQSGSNDTNLIYKFGPQGACGSIQYSDPTKVCKDKGSDSLDCASSTAQKNALQKIIGNNSSGLGGIAELFVQRDNEFANFYEYQPPPNIPGFSSSTTSSDTDWIPDWVGRYCTTPTTANPPGLGVPLEQCCNWKGCDAYTAFTTNTDVEEYTKEGIASTNPNSIKNIYSPFGMPTLYNIDFINTFTQEYIDSVMTKPLQDFVTKQPPNPKEWITAASSQGWLMAGGYYWNILQTKKSSMNASNPTLDLISVGSVVSPMDPSQRNLVTSASNLVLDIQTANEPPPPMVAKVPGNAAKIKKGAFAVSKAMTGLTANSTGALWTTNAGDPLLSLAVIGQKMMQSAKEAFAAITVAASLASMGSSIMAMVLGNGLTTNPFAAFITTAMSFLGPFIILFISTIFTAGAILGVYVPLIPYIIFTITAIGWFIAVIEAMVAAPFIALGIMMPSGQHELMGKAEHAIMLLFNLFLRPSLMIFGLITAMFLSWAAVSLINSAFFQVAYQIRGGSGDFIDQIIFIVAYVLIIITVLNKCYSLIHMLPERVLSYIGGQHVQFGEAQAMQDVRQGVQGAATTMERSATAAVGATAKSKRKEEGEGGGGQGGN